MMENNLTLNESLSMQLRQAKERYRKGLNEGSDVSLVIDIKGGPMYAILWLPIGPEGLIVKGKGIPIMAVAFITDLTIILNWECKYVLPGITPRDN
jgi:hypothetical protein